MMVYGPFHSYSEVQLSLLHVDIWQKQNWEHMGVVTEGSQIPTAQTQWVPHVMSHTSAWNPDID